MHSTERQPVKEEEVEAWLQELEPPSLGQEAVRDLLRRLVPQAPQLHWRRFQRGQVVVHRHNVGGHLFVVRDGTFEVNTRNAGTAEDGESGGRGRWTFRANEMFGEMEVEDRAKQREVCYSSSVLAREEGPRGHAEALEIPVSVTCDLMQSRSLLGDPFFNLLRRKVLDALLRYDPTSAQALSATTHKKVARVLVKHQGPKDEQKATARAVIAVASLLLQCLEGDRERGIIRGSGDRLVVVTHLHTAHSEVIGRTPNEKDKSSFNHSIRLLRSAGVLRTIRSVNTATDGGNELCLSGQFKEDLKSDEWVAGLATTARRGLDRLICLQSACFFLVDDELALRRCVMEPSLELIADLAQRRRLFFPQPADVEKARYDGLRSAVKESLRNRFTSDLWRADSFGMSLAAD